MAKKQRTYSVDENGWVTVNFPDGGQLRQQSVEAILLFEILRQLEGQAGRGLVQTGEYQR